MASSYINYGLGDLLGPEKKPNYHVTHESDAVLRQLQRDAVQEGKGWSVRITDPLIEYFRGDIPYKSILRAVIINPMQRKVAGELIRIPEGLEFIADEDYDLGPDFEWLPSWQPS